MTVGASLPATEAVVRRGNGVVVVLLASKFNACLIVLVFNLLLLVCIEGLLLLGV